MDHNLNPGPKRRRRRASDGTVCPPGSEAQRVYRGVRAWRKVCKYGGHPKPHPGRCVICRRLSDKARDMKPERAEQRLAASRKWEAKSDSKAKKAAWSKRRNARQEQKAYHAEKQRIYRRGQKLNNPSNPAEVAAKLLARAIRLSERDEYGIIGQINLERR